jgi:hypothetical protein
MGKKFFLKYIFTIIMLLVFALPEQAACDDKTYDIIVEKNLFSPQRKKWLLEEKQQTAPKQGPDIQKQLAQITLYGIVRTDEDEYAVIRVNQNKNSRRHNNLFMVGDCVNGFWIEDIRKKRIVLSAKDTKETYEVFLNDGKKDRSVIKTALPVTVPKQEKYSRKPRTAQTPEFLKKRVRKSINILKSNKSDLVKKQAERDLKKIEKMMMGMSDKQVQEIVDLKQQFEQLKN